MGKNIILKILIIGTLLLSLVGCTTKSENVELKKNPIKKQEAKVETTVKKIELKKVKKNVDKEDVKISIGEAEYVYLPATKIKLKARIDTGATTTSINALNIKQFERDGKRWVKFDLQDENKKIYPRKLPIYEIVSIKRHGTEDQKRPVVKMRINLASSSQLIRVSLTDRSKFTYPVLIGRNFLNGVIVVDVSKKYSAEPTKETK